MRFRPTVFLVCLLALGCLWIWASPVTALGHIDYRLPIDSLEWLVADAKYAGRGFVTHAVRIGDPDDSEEIKFWQITLEVEETFRGMNSNVITFVLPRGLPARLVTHGDQTAPEIFICLVDGNRGHHGELGFAGKLVPSLLLDFTEDGKAQNFWSDSTTAVYSMDLRSLSKRNEVLSAARKAADFSATEKRPISMTLSARRQEISNLDENLCFPLTVPVDERLEKLARIWLKSDRNLRVDAVRTLNHFRSEENIILLKELLHDTRTFVSRTRKATFPLSLVVDETETSRYYPLREASYRILQSWDVDVKEPVFEEYGIGWRRFLMIGMVLAGILNAAAVLTQFALAIRRRRQTALCS